MRQFFVYILSSRSRTLYVGVTNNVARRVDQHRRGVASVFTCRYRISRLVYVEVTQDIHSAIAREKQIKGWRREKKLALIEGFNPAWQDLAEGWGGEG
jgi:putative endonuclease